MDKQCQVHMPCLQVILGDIITAWDGRPVRNSADLFACLDGKLAGVACQHPTRSRPSASFKCPNSTTAAADNLPALKPMAGDRVRLELLRDGKTISTTICLAERGAAGAIEE